MLNPIEPQWETELPCPHCGKSHYRNEYVVDAMVPSTKPYSSGSYDYYRIDDGIADLEAEPKYETVCMECERTFFIPTDSIPEEIQERIKLVTMHGLEYKG